ncbi:MAG: ATP-binding protein [Candidatus Cloacimonetes bacterium]|nr:ATP-binding protein [Candidatus Cloacimonadota bacterium]
MYIKRNLEKTIERYINKPEIIAVIGTRQCGKTTMISHMLEQYKNVNIITLEDVDNKILFEEDIKSFINLYVKGYDYLFIDEVQYAKNSGKQLKYIYDTEKIKIIISGSSATDLSISSLKYLVGRIMIFELYPFSFKEFLSYKDERLYKIYQNKKFKQTINRELQKYIKEFIKYGGYPRVVTSTSDEEKKLILKNIFNTFLLREIKEILELNKSDKLVKLLHALAFQVGNLLNYNELSQITGFNYKNLKKYLAILEKTYICQRCYPFFCNKRKELVKMPKIYFIDHGFRNQCAGQFEFELQTIGTIYENLVYSENFKKGYKLKYWRTKSQAEVDFIQNDQIPLEIKTTPKITRSFLSFIKKYKPKTGYVVSETEKESRKIHGCEVKFLPFSKFI